MLCANSRSVPLLEGPVQACAQDARLVTRAIQPGDQDCRAFFLFRFSLILVVLITHVLNIFWWVSSPGPAPRGLHVAFLALYVLLLSHPKQERTFELSCVDTLKLSIPYSIKRPRNEQVIYC
jgi:hypothetical protein